MLRRLSPPGSTCLRSAVGWAVIALATYSHLFKTDDRAAAIMEKALAGTEQG
jgi:hypothetical protein